ncbi:hypothetical protein MO973_12120 [Paenibacillus sp. TRM 82003]|nr:hypothetical protein [Paenibacillus sp. TRM 82003]
MADVSLSTQQFPMGDLDSKYGGFTGPSAAIVVNGSDLEKLGAAIANIRVHTSASGDTDTVTFTVSDAFDMARREFKFLDKLEIGATLEVSLGYAHKNTAVFSGYITAVSFRFPNDAAPEIVVTGMDASFKLMRSQNAKTWLNKKISDVVKEVAGAHGITTSEVEDTSVTYKMISKGHESDFVFLQNLATKLNFECFIVGKKLYFRKKFANKTPVTTLSYGKDLVEFILEQNLYDQVSSVEVRGWDATTKKPIVEKAESHNATGKRGKSGKALLAAIGGNYREVVYANPETAADASAMAAAIFNERALRLVSGEGECLGIPEMRAGRFISIEGMGAKLNDTFYLVRVTHDYDTNGFRTRFQIQGNVV